MLIGLSLQQCDPGIAKCGDGCCEEKGVIWA